MKASAPSKVLITGGREVGGVASFAEGLRAGFSELGIPAEVVSPLRIFTRWSDLRDPRILKILSTTAVFAAPFARRTICVAHGFPRADVQGWVRFAGIIASYKLANWTSRLITVSRYTAAHLRAIFKLRIDAAIHNPVGEMFLAPGGNGAPPRDYITFAGRLHPSKGLERVFPAIRAVLSEASGLGAAIVGDGQLCLAIPGKIEEIAVEGGVRMGRVNFDGVVKRVCLDCVPEAGVGDYAIVHAGFAISKVDEESARETLALFPKMGTLDEELAGEEEVFARAAGKPQSSCPDGGCSGQ